MPNDLDAQIHAQVMGLTWDASRCRVCGGHIDDALGRSGYPWVCTSSRCAAPYRHDRADHDVPPYSADLAAAWRVVEHLREQGYAVTLEYGRFDPTTDVPGYEVTFRRLDDVHASGPSSTGYAATVAEAICLAALEVVS
jgi:hypothetical protein